MTFRLREWFRRLWGTFHRDASERDEELRFHLEMAETDALRRGQSVREARLRPDPGSQESRCSMISPS